MKSRPLSFSLLLPLLAATAHAQYVDNFNTTTTADSPNYVATAAYKGGGGSTSPATFNINGLGQLQPGADPNDTTIFLNKKWALSDTIFGQSVSLDLVNVANPATDTGSQLGADSIGFSNSMTPATGTTTAYSVNDFELGILRYDDGYYIASSNTSVVQASIHLDVNFSLGAVTETITRVANNSFDYEFSGPGFVGVYSGLIVNDGPLIGTFTVNGSIATGHTLYFGPDVFGGNTGNDQIEDNLVYVPEPSAFALALAGAGFLVLLVRRMIKNT